MLGEFQAMNGPESESQIENRREERRGEENSDRVGSCEKTVMGREIKMERCRGARRRKGGTIIISAHTRMRRDNRVTGCSPIQCSTVQYSTLQRCKVQYSVV
jgi:hypothetical protein